MANISFGNGGVMNKVSSYASARVRVVTDNVSDVTGMMQSEGAIGDAVQVLASGFGLLPTTDYGKRAQDRRVAARRILTQ